jgi:hypothetical protein
MGVRHDDKTSCVTGAEKKEAVLVLGVIWVEPGDRQRVAECGRRLFEGKTKLSQGPVVSALLEHDIFTIFPVNPGTLAKYRRAFTPSRAKDDPTDEAIALDLRSPFLLGSRLLRQSQGKWRVSQRDHQGPCLQMDPHPISLLGGSNPLRRVPIPVRAPEAPLAPLQIRRRRPFTISLRSASGRGLDADKPDGPACTPVTTILLSPKAATSSSRPPMAERYRCRVETWQSSKLSRPSSREMSAWSI